MYFGTTTVLTADGTTLDAGADEAAEINGEALASGSSLQGRAQRINGHAGKRGVDIVLALSALLFLLPALLVIAVAIKLDSKGPVLFRQKRYGVGRKTFKLYKFRSMTVMEANGAFTQAQRGDARITAVGAVLRRTSLDELPQLINVLKGEMSLVGPRPHAVAMDQSLAPLLPHYVDRHLVRPGMTGLAQMAGHRGPTDALDQVRARLRYDRAYIRKWSLLLDLKLIAETPLKLLGPNAF